MYDIMTMRSMRHDRHGAVPLKTSLYTMVLISSNTLPHTIKQFVLL